MKSVKNFFHDKMMSSSPVSPTNETNGSLDSKTKSTDLSATKPLNETVPSQLPKKSNSNTSPLSTPKSDYDLKNADQDSCLTRNIRQPPPPSPSSTSSSSATQNKLLPSDRHSTGSSGGFSLFSTKSQKGRRKISLPWFRQNSVTTPHVGLSRQHTIDSPGSFRFFRQSSNNSQVGNLEVTWVVSDYTGTPGTNELSVTKGQQVEVVEISSSNEPDFCLVRLNPQTDDGAAREGLVPISILKPPPGSQKNNKKDNDASQDLSNNRKGADNLLTSQSTKRRGFSGRKWLPQPLRKLSQGKVDKPPERLVKKGSEKNMKLPEKDETTLTTSTSAQNTSTNQDEAEEEVTFELPPPMKPIQEPCVISNGPPASYKDLKENASNMANTFKKLEGNAAADLSEIEQIVKEKTEQHEVKSKFLKPIDISNSDNGKDENEENTEQNDIEAAQKKRMCALHELLSTEELYIQDLSEIVNGYISEIRNVNSEIAQPDDLKGGKERMVFGNIEAIYEWHRDFFLKALQRSLKTPSELGQVIKRYERKFHMYHVYCQNKPVSEHIVAEHQLYFDQIRQKLKHRLDLSDMLIKPVQRITKYELLLKEITRQTDRAGLVEELSGMQEAYSVMKIVCKTINDMMDVRRLQKFDGKITAQGKLLLHGPLICIEDTSKLNDSSRQTTSVVQQKPRELQVFLFEQSIIFSDIVGKKTQFTSPSYIYRSHIQVNKMQLEELPNNRFLLKSTDPNRSDAISLICSAATIELNHEWLETIRNILQSQHDFLKAIQSPIAYQKELTKDS